MGFRLKKYNRNYYTTVLLTNDQPVSFVDFLQVSALNNFSFAALQTSIYFNSYYYYFYIEMKQGIYFINNNSNQLSFRENKAR